MLFFRTWIFKLWSNAWRCGVSAKSQIINSRHKSQVIRNRVCIELECRCVYIYVCKVIHVSVWSTFKWFTFKLAKPKWGYGTEFYFEIEKKDFVLSICDKPRWTYMHLTLNGFVTKSRWLKIWHELESCFKISMQCSWRASNRGVPTLANIVIIGHV